MTQVRFIFVCEVQPVNSFHNQLFSIHFISFINSPKANNVREEHMAPGAVTQSVKLPAGHVRHAVAPVDEYLESSAQSSHSFCPAELYLPA